MTITTEPNANGLPASMVTDFAINDFSALQADVKQYAAALDYSKTLVGESTLAAWYDELEASVNGLASVFWSASRAADLDTRNELVLQAFIPSDTAISRRRQLCPLIEDYGVDVTDVSMHSSHQLTIPVRQVTAVQFLSHGDQQTLRAKPVMNLRVQTAHDKPNQVMSRDQPGKIIEQPSIGRWYGFLLRNSDISLKRVPVRPQTQAG